MLIVGLGNPGKEYEKTYHNMGYLVVESLAKKLSKRIIRTECSSLTAVMTKNGDKIILAKPLTYMNLSGQAVKSLMTKYGQTEDKLVVIYDDIDIPRFTVRVRTNGSAGTHNGMRNIIDVIKSHDFIRIRMGIGRDEGELKDYVLSKPGKIDGAKFAETADRVATLLEKYVTDNDVDSLLREGNVIGKTE